MGGILPRAVRLRLEQKAEREGVCCVVVGAAAPPVPKLDLFQQDFMPCCSSFPTATLAAAGWSSCRRQAVPQLAPRQPLCGQKQCVLSRLLPAALLFSARTQPRTVQVENQCMCCFPQVVIAKS